MMLRSLTLALAATFGLGACQPAIPAPEIAARWDHRSEAEAWYGAMIDALGRDGTAMIDAVPRDAETFCPGYASATPAERKAVWIMVFSGLARYESNWRPEAAGAGGRYRGLLQISPATARFHGCDLSHPGGLYDGATNLACAVRIANSAVARDGVIATGRGGMAADWPPLRSEARRSEIAGFTRALPQCRAG